MKNTVNPIENLSENLILVSKMQKSFAITGEHLGAIPFTTWSNAVRKLHAEAYKVVHIAHDDDLTKMDTTIDKSALYGAIREVLALIGEVNGHKLNCNEAVAIMAVAEASRTVNVYHGEALMVKSQLDNVKSALRKVEDADNGVSEGYIANLEKQKSEFEEKLAELKLVPDMVTVERTRVNDKSFRASFEHYLGDLVTGQKMKSWDELEAEAKARKDAKNKKNNERKRANKSK